MSPLSLSATDLLIVGSPTQKFSPTDATKAFLDGLAGHALQGIHVAAFDTRFTEETIAENRALDFFVGIFGYAAEPILRRLEKKGGTPAGDALGIYVADMEGPLLEGELERAAQWASDLHDHLS